MGIRIFVTGGTIDALEYDSPEGAPKSHQSLITGLLKQARATSEYHVDVLMSKDSKFITDDDRALILKKCLECPEDKIIITHGTMTLPVTAKYLGVRNPPKTIVLTGSAIPANAPNSDAMFNLGSAFSAVQLLPPGVYVLMNGKLFPWDNVKKNLDSGFFEAEA